MSFALYCARSCNMVCRKVHRKSFSSWNFSPYWELFSRHLFFRCWSAELSVSTACAFSETPPGNSCRASCLASRKLARYLPYLLRLAVTGSVRWSFTVRLSSAGLSCGLRCSSSLAV